MIRLLLLLVLMIVVGRLFWSLIDGVFEGLSGRKTSHKVRRSSVQMVRDPVCGTFVVPGGPHTLSDGRTQWYFCSSECRDTYQSRQARRA